MISKSLGKSVGSKAGKPYERHFLEVAEIIREGRRKAYSAVDTVLMDTYWNVGKYISQKIESAQ